MRSRRLHEHLRLVDRTWVDDGAVYLLLPETSRAGADSLIGRLQMVAADLLPGDVRVATFPDDGLTSGALISAVHGASLTVRTRVLRKGFPTFCHHPGLEQRFRGIGVQERSQLRIEVKNLCQVDLLHPNLAEEPDYLAVASDDPGLDRSKAPLAVDRVQCLPNPAFPSLPTCTRDDGHEHVIVARPGRHTFQQFGVEEGHIARHDEAVFVRRVADGGVDAAESANVRVDIGHDLHAERFVPLSIVGDDREVVGNDPQLLQYEGQHRRSAVGRRSQFLPL